MLFATKLIESSGNRILNVCDPELLDKTVKDGKTTVKISSSYYKEKMRDEIEIEQLTKVCTSLNLVGENTISLAIKSGIGSEKAVRRIEGIPFLIVFSM